jgi:hypothetical protein
VNIDENTGEVFDDAPEPMAVVPLNLAELNEDQLAQLIPTPAQAAAALGYARAVAARAPAALNRYRRELRTAERELTIALALGAEKVLEIYPRMAMTERRDIARATDARVKAAQDAVDTAWLTLEYARDYDRAIGRDIDILRSLNANLRTEVHS